jgi:protein involved in polysaccharide export with SLBB domain
MFAHARVTILRFAIALLLVIQCAVSFADLTALDPLARPNTKIGPGFVISMNVTVRGLEDQELCSEFTLDKNANLQLLLGGQPIDKINLMGLTASQAEMKIQKSIAPYYAVTPDVSVGIAKIPRIQVIMEGATFRNGLITLPLGDKLSDALAQTGYEPSADLSHIQIIRMEANNNRTTLNVNFSQALEQGGNQYTDPVLQNLDHILVPISSAPPIDQTIMVLGEVRNEGAYPYKRGMTVADALSDANGLLPTADPDDVILRRASDTNYMTLSATKAEANIPTDNIALRPGDTIFVNTKDTGLRYAVVGAVPTPGAHELRGNVTLSQAIVNAGGFLPNADRKHILLIRNMLTNPAKAQNIPIDYDKLVAKAIPDISLQAGDMIQVPTKGRRSMPLLDIGMFLLKLFAF